MPEFALYEDLMDASFNGDIKTVKKLVDLGVDITYNDFEAFCHACSGGHLDMVKWFDKNRVYISVSNDFPLRQAYNAGHWNIVDWFASKGVTTWFLSEEQLE